MIQRAGADGEGDGKRNMGFFIICVDKDQLRLVKDCPAYIWAVFPGRFQILILKT